MYYNLIPRNLYYHCLRKYENPPHSENGMNLLHKKFENFYKKFNKSNKHRASTLPTSKYECYEQPVEIHRKIDFQSLHLHTFYSNKRNCSRAKSLCEDFFEDVPDYQDVLEEFILYLSSNCIWHFSCFSNNITVSLTYPSKCWPNGIRSQKLDENHAFAAYIRVATTPQVHKPVWEVQTPALLTMAQASPQPQYLDTMRGWTHCLHLLHLHRQLNFTYTLRVTRAHPQCSSDLRVLHKSSSSKETSRCHSHCTHWSANTHATIGAKATSPAPHSSSWADEVAAAEQSDRSTPETVVHNWPFSCWVPGPRRRSQPLVSPPPVMSTPLTQPPSVASPRYGPTNPPLQPQSSFLNLHFTIDPPLRISTRVRTLCQGDAPGLWQMRFTQCAPRKFRPLSRLLHILLALHEAYSPHPHAVEVEPNIFLPL